MKFIGSVLLFFISFTALAQNNYIVKTEDGRRVLLKADYTWEYIDAIPQSTNQQVDQPAPVNPNPEPIAEQSQIQNPPAPILMPHCGLGPNFKEPKLNTKIQAQLKKGRATMKHLKQKVAKDFACTPTEVILLNLSEDKAKGSYTFCVKGNKVDYKRMGNAFFRKNKFF